MKKKKLVTHQTGVASSPAVCVSVNRWPPTPENKKKKTTWIHQPLCTLYKWVCSTTTWPDHSNLFAQWDGSWPNQLNIVNELTIISLLFLCKIQTNDLGYQHQNLLRFGYYFSCVSSSSSCVLMVGPPVLPSTALPSHSCPLYGHLQNILPFSKSHSTYSTPRTKGSTFLVWIGRKWGLSASGVVYARQGIHTLTHTHIGAPNVRPKHFP